jgi:hypothetical protein
VSCIKFDLWRSDARNYRFGSVGHDGKLLFWDFAVKGHARSGRYSGMRTSSFTGSMSVTNRRMSTISHQSILSNCRFGDLDRHVFHPSLPAYEVPVVEPIMVRVLQSAIFKFTSTIRRVVSDSCKIYFEDLTISFFFCNFGNCSWNVYHACH